MSLAPARVCETCDSFPCRCLRPRLIVGTRERYERCACGGTVVAKDVGDVFRAVKAHNATVGHNVWRARNAL